MTVGTLAPNEKDLYKIVHVVRQLAEGRSNISAAAATALLNVFTGDSGSGGGQGLVPAPEAGDSPKLLRGSGGWATSAQATAFLSSFIGDSGSGGVKGLVPAPAAGDALKVLLGNGTWRTQGIKAGSLTRDMAAACGNVSYTGIGFTPNAIIFFANRNGTAVTSWGYTTGPGNNVCIFDDNGDSAATYAIAVDKCMYGEVGGGGNNQKAALSAFDGDGFTLSWIKTGSPTGTFASMFLAARI